LNRQRARFKDALRTQLWPAPALGVVLAVGIGATLPMLDAALAGQLPPAASAWLFGGGPDAARAMLQAVAGSLITVTSLTFSLTVVTLQLASSQFSPRLLRTFSADRVVHLTLALFLEPRAASSHNCAKPSRHSNLHRRGTALARAAGRRTLCAITGRP
jgi:uncharacterized membrane protein